MSRSDQRPCPHIRRAQAPNAFHRALTTRRSGLGCGDMERGRAVLPSPWLLKVLRGPAMVVSGDSLEREFLVNISYSHRHRIREISRDRHVLNRSVICTAVHVWEIQRDFLGGSLMARENSSVGTRACTRWYRLCRICWVIGHPLSLSIGTCTRGHQIIYERRLVCLVIRVSKKVEDYKHLHRFLISCIYLDIWTTSDVLCVLYCDIIWNVIWARLR